MPVCQLNFAKSHVSHLYGFADGANSVFVYKEDGKAKLFALPGDIKLYVLCEKSTPSPYVRLEF